LISPSTTACALQAGAGWPIFAGIVAAAFTAGVGGRWGGSVVQTARAARRPLSAAREMSPPACPRRLCPLCSCSWWYSLRQPPAHKARSRYWQRPPSCWPRSGRPDGDGGVRGLHSTLSEHSHWTAGEGLAAAGAGADISHAVASGTGMMMAGWQLHQAQPPQ
jgi:hypothetical protein